MSHTNREKLQSLGIEVRASRGQVKVLCPRCSHTRKNRRDPCLSVNIDTGVYNCHNPGCDFKGTVGYTEREKKQYIKPEWSNVTALSDEVVRYWAGRKISQATLNAMRIAQGREWMPQHQKEVAVVLFPYIRNGEVVNIKYRGAGKAFKMVKDAELVFYNLDSLKDAAECLIVEGEPDCLSFIEAGYTPVVSVPNGASKGSQKLEYLDNCWQAFEGMKKIYLGTDADEAGVALRNELARRLGPERCWFLDYRGCKDGNEFLQKYGAIELADTIAKARPFPIEGVFTVDEIAADVQDIYEKGLPPGETIDQPEFDALLTFYPGQLTTATGIPNHGKSDFIDHVAARLAVFRGWKFGVFSPENFPLAFHVSKLVEKLVGKPFGGEKKMRQEELDAAMEFLQRHFFFIRPGDENFTLENVLELARLLVVKHGIKGLIIDPWNTLEWQLPPGMTGTDYISAQLAKLISFLQRYGLHGFLVAHPTKVKKDKNTGRYDIPTLYDIAGSANFFNKTFNGFCVYRDFDRLITTVYVQKVKFKHLGKIGYVEYRYDLENGRYNVDHTAFDKRNYLRPEAEQGEIFEVVNNGAEDDMPF